MQIHAFTDDALGTLDAVGLAGTIASGEVAAPEAVAAAVLRAGRVEVLNAVRWADFERARVAAPAARGVFAGVPTFVKDNTDVAGLPTHHGSQAVSSPPAAADAAVVDLLRATGLVVLGKTTLPEFGWNASVEHETLPPTRNPWDTAYSTGASSGGSAALVAAGVVPIAHANDGGGSIRIPAAACGLVGLKPTRGRVPRSALGASMPVDIISDGVLTRTVRDTAHFLAASQAFRPAPGLPPLGLVSGPGRRRRIGVILDSVTGIPTDDETRAAVLRTAGVLTGLGHDVAEVALPVRRRFVDDFVQYYSMLAFSTQHFGKHVLTPHFDRHRTDALTRHLARHFRNHLWRTPGALLALRRSEAEYRAQFDAVDLILTPTVAHTTPVLGHLSPAVRPVQDLLDRLIRYAAFTPFNNAAGGPAVSLPLARTAAGLPLGLQFSAAHGDEQGLLEIAYELEAQAPFAALHHA